MRGSMWQSTSNEGLRFDLQLGLEGYGGDISVLNNSFIQYSMEAEDRMAEIRDIAEKNDIIADRMGQVEKLRDAFVKRGGGSLTSSEREIVQSAIECISDTKVSTYALESNADVVASLENILKEGWGFLKEGLYDALVRVGSWFELYGRTLLQIGDFLLNIIGDSLAYVFLPARMYTWYRLGGDMAISHLKMNESMTEVGDAKIASEIKKQADNSAEFFDNWAKFVKVYADGVSKIFPKLDTSDTNKIVHEIENYNRTTGKSVVDALEKCFSYSASGWSSKTLLGGWALFLGNDIRNFNIVRLRVGKASSEQSRAIDTSPKMVQLTEQQMNDLFKVLHKNTSSIQEDMIKIKSMTDRVARETKGLLRLSYGDLDGETQVIIRNFARDTNQIVRELSSGQVLKYADEYARLLKVFCNLARKK